MLYPRGAMILIPGLPERSFLGSVKLRNRPRLGVYAQRWRGCGLLHLYAPGDPPVA